LSILLINREYNFQKKDIIVKLVSEKILPQCYFKFNAFELACLRKFLSSPRLSDEYTPWLCSFLNLRSEKGFTWKDLEKIDSIFQAFPKKLVSFFK
jgi:hypothetical protein